MYPGGISNKTGNRYESLWTVLHFLRVLNGDLRAITVEKLGKENDGFEFHVKKPDGTEKWLQSKINASGGNWTPKALKTAGVLDAFRKRLKDPNCICQFVSQDGTHVLREACNDARIAGNLEVYNEHASEDRKQALQVFSEGLTGESAEAIAFDHLTRCHFDNASTEVIQSTVKDLSNFLFKAPEHVLDSVVGFLEVSINRCITTEESRNWARGKTILELRPVLDPTASERIAEANATYLASHSNRGFGGAELDRGYAALVLKKIQNGTSLIMVSGGAGSGKTIAVRQLLALAEKSGMLALAIRLDKSLDAGTPLDLGKVNGLPESPAYSLARLAEGEPSLLIIDQIDAVSDLAGRSASVRDALFATLREVGLHPDLHCVLVCRDYDLEGDDRFRALLESNFAVTVKQGAPRISVEPMDWATEILPLLKDNRLKGEFTESQKKLLSSPLNLSLFLSIDRQHFSPDTQSDLFHELLDQVQKTDKDKPLFKGLEAMAGWMSDKHRLRCPDFVLRPFPGLKDWLASEGLIVAECRHLHFMHESLFDYIFATAYLQQDKSLLAFLCESEQSLFRRTQVRQILQESRSIDWSWYLKNLREVLHSADVRPHIKLAVARWLSQVPNPTQDEYEIIQDTDNADGFFSTVVCNAFMSGPNWMPLLVKQGFIKAALASSVEERSRHMSRWFAQNAGHHPKLVADFMRDWWKNDPERTNALVDWFRFVDRKGSDEALASLLVDVLAARPTKLFQGDRDYIYMLLDPWIEGAPVGVDRILAELMECWFDAHAGSHPFAFDVKRNLDLYYFDKLAEENPDAFLQGILPTILKTLNIIEQSEDTAKRWLTSSRYKSNSDDLLTIIFSAFETLAANVPRACEDLIVQLKPQRHHVIAHLWLVCMAKAPEQLVKHLDLLGECQNLLSCGYYGATYYAFAEAARALLETDASPAEEVEALFIDAKPEHKWALEYLVISREEKENRANYRKRAVECLQDTGKTVWGILTVIGRELLSAQGRAIHDQLQRKFAHLPVQNPRISRVRSVVSPLPAEAVAAMTDVQWLSAIKTYDSDDWRGNETEQTIAGGARELARLLCEVAKTDPVRFLHFALQIPDDAYPSYLTSCIEGVSHAEDIDIGVVTPLLIQLFETRRDACGRQLCNLVSRHPNLVRDEAVLQMCLWYAVQGDGPEPGEKDLEQARKRTVKIEQIQNSGSDIFIDGNVDTRTCAWAALTQALWQDPPRLDLIWPVLSEAVDSEVSLMVRMGMLEAFKPIYDHDQEYFKDGLRRLIKARGKDVAGQELYPLAGYSGYVLTGFISNLMPKDACDFIKQMIGSGDEVLDHIGSWWAMVHSLNYELDSDWIETIKHRSPAHLRLWVRLLSQCAAATEYRNYAIEQLGSYFDHEQVEVRNTAAKVFREIKPSEFGHFRDLANRFVKSRAILNCGYGFLHLLVEAGTGISELVLSAAEVLLRDIVEKGEQLGSRGLDLRQLQGMLRAEYQASEGKEEKRKRVLDLIDFMIEHRLYGTEDLLALGDK